MPGYYSIAIGVVIVLVLFIFVYVVFFKTKSNLTDMLTGVINANTSYTVTRDVVSTKNKGLPSSNYAISIWYYVSSWFATDENKNILTVPNLLELTLGTTTNDLYVKMYGSANQSVVPQSLTSVDVSKLTVNTVYKYSNTFVFVYKKNNGDKPWRKVRVAFSIDSSDRNTVITKDSLASGGHVNSFLLEEASTIGNSRPTNINTPVTACNNLAWTCSKQTDFTCPTSRYSPENYCIPDIDVDFATYPTSVDKTAAVYTIRNSAGDAYFSEGQTFTFIYYPQFAAGTPEPNPIIDPATIMAQYPSGFTSDYDLYESVAPSAQYSSSVLIPLDTSVYENIIEPLSNEFSTRNVPLQMWTNVVLNVMGKNLTIYINGQISSAYVLPFVPYQMDQSIILARTPSFVGSTSGLQYIPDGVSAGEVRNIYNSGYLGKSTVSNALTFFNRYSLKVVFVDNSAKLLK
jgi:hypothetical protein